ncbi:MAG: thioredoxin domain-containing protein [Rhodobacteraceae bacterium]|nr:thioredoxin domain-containing protein [Paracoccaceae bacterium]
MLKRLIPLILALLALPALALADGLQDMSDGERDAFRAEVRAYLLDNPEVLMEAIAVLEQRKQEQQANNDSALLVALSDEIFNDGYSYVGGNPDGDITLVEFLDYRCGYCRKAHDEVHELIESDGNIRLVIKEFPILGEQSVLSARLAVATLHKSGPEAYRRLGDFLMTFNGSITAQNVGAILENLEIEAAPVVAYMDDPAVSGQIGAVHVLAEKLAITGTPTFAIGAELLRGYLPLENMREVVAYYRNQQQ